MTPTKGNSNRKLELLGSSTKASLGRVVNFI